MLEFLDALFGVAHALLTFEEEGFGDDRDREHPAFLGRPCDDRSGARAGAPAHAGSDKDHVRALDGLLQFFLGLFNGALAELGVHAGAEAPGQILADVDFLLGQRVVKVLGVSINGDKIDSLNLRIDHVVDRILAGTAHSDDLDSGERLYFWFDLGHAFKLNDGPILPKGFGKGKR